MIFKRIIILSNTKVGYIEGKELEFTFL